MNATEITFGVEIETTIPAATLNTGGYGNGAPIEALSGWVASSDGSIRTTAGRVGCEFVSPVLKGADGVRSILAAIAYIKSIGGRVNPSCGLHVHVGFNKSDTAAVERLTTLVANFETAIYASTGTRSRERGNYCRPIAHFGNFAQANQVGRVDRYRVCNLATNKPTIEFRAFAGTLDTTKIIGHVRMCIGLAEQALKSSRPTNWVAKPVARTSPIARSGLGQTALTRLFYKLGWTKGRTDHVYGDVTAEAAPGLKTIKRKLMSLARKYDSQP